ncbi:hypothetical protein AKJ63_01495 [candidate division MSBL1 archaeon SCGC-AAA259D18]|uniref:Uncharacterized protein n=1 Tax=candidate division MSBL1 archaeon SCGC-AAA259D18 TaxID=1698262 RepID=A0A133UB28_9EURY|nr:hypothetical protein AKJ63_01495 [candidate division MSBL1 archaeon SCGC-AAA259D18]
MTARTAEVIQIKAPIRRQIRHLDGNSEKTFSKLLNETVSRLRKNDYKLIHVTKSYRRKGKIRTDNFWKKETKVENIKVVWLCTFSLVFKRGFKFQLDFDYWFEFSKFLQNLRGDLYARGFPYTSRSFAENFGKGEATRALEKIKTLVKEKMKSQVNGWGEHGIIDEVTDRKSPEIRHQKEISISSLSELDNLRNSLDELTEEPAELVKNSQREINKIARKKLKELIPLSIDPNSLEGYLSFFLWFRKPGGGFEYQLYRLIQENYDILSKNKIRDALLRLETHGYIKVRETPENLRKKMEKRGIKRCRRFYEIEGGNVPGKELFDELRDKTRIGAYLAPLPEKRLVKHLDAPDHLVQKELRKLKRRNYLSERKVRDFSGRSVTKIKPKKNYGGTKGLKKQIMKKAGKFYEVQKEALDQLQEIRPDRTPGKGE